LGYQQAIYMNMVGGDVTVGLTFYPTIFSSDQMVFLYCELQLSVKEQMEENLSGEKGDSWFQTFG